MSRRSQLDRALGTYVRGHDRVWEHARKRGAAADVEMDVEFGALPAPPRFGVGVAEQLDFRLGPAAWRDRADSKSA